MQLTCSHCRRVLEYSGDAPVFCGYCGHTLGGKSDVATAEFAPSAESIAAAATLPPDPARAASHPPRRDLPGRELAGYRLVRELGRGGMGAVWEAEHIDSGRRVALKLLAPGQELAPVALDRFVREGQLAAALSHPRTTFVFEAGAHDGQPFITMELMPGDTLADLSRKEGALPVARAVDYMLDVIEGLEAAHAAGVIHRDVKPSNCFLAYDGRVKIGDFGLSKSLVSDAALTRTGAFMGTPMFAAPEQVRGGNVDERTDIYAVGATLFYLIARRGPFEGDATAVIAQIVSDPAPSLRSLCPAVPKDLDHAVARTLEKDPNRRFANLGDLRTALLPFASVGVTPAPLGRRLGAYFLDVVIAAIIGMLVATLLLVGLVIFEQTLEQSITANADESFMSWIAGGMQLFLAGMILYFAVPEARAGRSFGKRLLGLRVMRPDGSRPRFWRCLLRAMFVPGLAWSAMLLLMYLRPSAFFGAETIDPTSLLVQQVMNFVPFLPTGICLVTMRRSNGYRGLHDLVSGTRVVMLRPATEDASQIDVAVVQLQRLDDGPRNYGPFAVRGLLGRCGNATVYGARDELLKRRAWVFVRPADAPAIPAERVHIGRVARPRWLQGGVSGDERWDAFEAVFGAPLAEQMTIGWSDGRVVLLDLVEELDAALTDGTLPKDVSLDHLWIDQEGHARLLDDPLIEDAEPPALAATLPTAEAAAVSLFHEAVALCTRGPSLPVYAREFVAELQSRPHERSTLTWAAQQLRDFVKRPATVRWSDRLVSLGVSFGLEYVAFEAVVSLLGLALLQIPGLPLPVFGGLIVVAALGLPALVGYWMSGGPVFRLVGLAVRRADGSPASRMRCAVRNLVAWFLLLLIFGLNIALVPVLAKKGGVNRPGMGTTMGSPAVVKTSNPKAADAAKPGANSELNAYTITAGLLSCGSSVFMYFCLIGAIYAIVRPQRGLQDLIAGTRLVQQ